VGGAWEQADVHVLLLYLPGATLQGGYDYNRVCECLG